MKLVDGLGAQPQMKQLDMSIQVPAQEEPVFSIMLIVCKGGSVYVGHPPGAERGAHKLCLQGAETMNTAMAEALKKFQEADILKLPPGFTLPDFPARRES